jgi:hypothetical protein
MKNLLTIVFLCLSLLAAAQQKPEPANVDAVQQEKRTGFLLCDLGLLVGTVENEMKTPLSFNAIFDLPIYKSIYFGLGSGLEFYQNTYVPLLAEFRIKPLETGIALVFQAGYAMPVTSTSKMPIGEFKFKPGFLVNPGISYTFPTAHNAAFTISMAYRYQKMKSERINVPNQYYYQDYEIINEMNRFNIRIGYTFKK